MVMVSPIALYFVSVARRKAAILYQAILLVMVAGTLVSGARTAMFALFLQLLFITFLSMGQPKKWAVARIIIVISLLTVLYVLVSDIDFFVDQVFERYTRWTGKGGFFFGDARYVFIWPRMLENIKPWMMLVGYAHPGIPDVGTAHNELFGILYYSGGIALVFYCIATFRNIYNLKFVDRGIMKEVLLLSLLSYMITGVAYENFVHQGQPYYFWTIMAIASRYKYLEE